MNLVVFDVCNGFGLRQINPFFEKLFSLSWEIHPVIFGQLLKVNLITIDKVLTFVWDTSPFSEVGNIFVIGLKPFFHIVLLLCCYSIESNVLNVNMFECLFPNLIAVAFSSIFRDTYIKPKKGIVIVIVRNCETCDGLTVEYADPIGVFIEMLNSGRLILAKIPANFVTPTLNSLIVLGLEVSDYKGHLMINYS